MRSKRNERKQIICFSVYIWINKKNENIIITRVPLYTGKRERKADKKFEKLRKLISETISVLDAISVY